MEALDLARIQFALNITVHFLFPSITIALGWVLLGLKFAYARTGAQTWMHIYALFAKIDSVPWSGVRGRAFASDICCLHVGYVSCHPLIFDSGCFGFRAGGTTGDLLPFEVGTSGDGPLISLLG